MEPVFPLDLEREIFETAAYRHKRTIPALLLVCRRVHTWIEPLLYRVLTINSDDEKLLSTLESMMQSRPAAFFQSAVRHIFLWHSTASARRKRFLEHCAGTINIYIVGNFPADFFPALSHMRLQRLALTGPLPPHLGLDHPVFLSITHLDIWTDPAELDGSDRWESWAHLASLPALTHLALSEEVAYAILPQVIGECAHLRVMLILTRSSRFHAFPSTLTVTDPRVVVTPLGDFDADWTRGAWGGDDMWARAENYVAQKRSGEIPSAFFPPVPLICRGPDGVLFRY
ncbi:hypothetical protein FB451DRAFT_185198 [Mycena latifolia]|nr:hypothetical protein FB451DRAFT_185198 [Mycena latifolia]